MLNSKTEDLDIMVFILNHALIVISSQVHFFVSWTTLNASLYQEEQRMGFPTNKLEIWSVKTVFFLTFCFIGSVKSLVS
jgi:hypothetical protein